MAVSFATGGGLLVDAITKSDKFVDFAKSFDKVKDTAKKVGNGIKEVVDKITDCFVAGTMIATEEGHLPIQNIKIGDYVWATNPETGETALKQVVNTFINETTAVTHVTINGEVITSTQTHPYYVANSGWVLAKNLRAGDILVMLNGEQVVLELVQHEILESPIVTYNFEVEDFHTYYVGENDVLVHNKCFRGELLEVKQWVDKATGCDAHHVFPRKFRDKFDKVDLKWNNGKEYGTWWELHDHRKNAKAYNKEWEVFFNGNQSRTKEEILNKGRELAKKYGFDILF